MIERKILIALITSGEFLREIEDEWNPEYFESQAAKLLSGWCWEYFAEYGEAPMQNIEDIYLVKLKAKKVSDDLAEEISEEFLPSLSEEYEKERNPKYLIQEARNFFDQRQIQIHFDEVAYLVEKGDLKEAKERVEQFQLKTRVEAEGLDVCDEGVLERVERAFDETYQNVVRFPGPLGEFWNDYLVRGGLVSLLAPEKRGKSFWLLEFLMRAYNQGRSVALFQAGDMTEEEQIVRMGVYLAQRSDKERYCGEQFVPIADCIRNQKDTCTKNVRECSFGLFGEEMNTREDITREDLIEAHDSNPDYKPCFNCTDWGKNAWGTPWLQKKDLGGRALTKKQAVRLWRKRFVKGAKRIKISTHANLTLRVKDIEKILAQWKEKEGFVPDVILIDYADILAPEVKGDVRERENHKWMRLRALSQTTKALVVVPTQADADSYKKDKIDMSNFSETKTKNAHVTAMFGLNQDKEGREKEIGIMRINKIVVRQGDFHHTQQVHVLQHLQMGRPLLGSYF